MFLDLLKRIFCCWKENIRLNKINRAIDDYYKAKEKCSRKLYAMAALVEDFETRYGNNYGGVEDNG